MWRRCNPTREDISRLITRRRVLRGQIPTQSPGGQFGRGSPGGLATPREENSGLREAGNEITGPGGCPASPPSALRRAAYAEGRSSGEKARSAPQSPVLPTRRSWRHPGSAYEWESTQLRQIKGENTPSRARCYGAILGLSFVRSDDRMRYIRRRNHSWEGRPSAGSTGEDASGDGDD